ncbi:hypothetical protein P4H66_13825 [Paenibacillus dokdonensis]|uniref:Uncharacterized protein n=1 Tax=Paenibacillus dokdonensis TaxID=2567944 RepID=A0ABU6GNF9_9BACL|nr:hypothetical protein [Paenibacillus dokdonensis]MEC0240929.1 hypothetical protein [Paenibacillus dokdonensis]
MYLAAWIDANDITDTQSRIIVTGLAVILFLWLYIRTARSFKSAATARLDWLQQTLGLYSRAAGMLDGDGAVDSPAEHEQETESLILLLQQCKAAPLVTTELLEAIDAYLKERDSSRHTQLQKMLEREISRRIREQSSIIRSLDNPGWGIGFWKLIRPAVPFAALVLILYWCLQLYQEFHGPDIPALSWASAELWMWFVSCLAAVISFYLAVMTPRKDSTKASYRILALFISAAALAHFAGLTAAPYILAVQFILFLVGFGIHPKRSRRNRPYAGSTELLEASTDIERIKPEK